MTGKLWAIQNMYGKYLVSPRGWEYSPDIKKAYTWPTEESARKQLDLYEKVVQVGEERT